MQASLNNYKINASFWVYKIFSFIVKVKVKSKDSHAVKPRINLGKRYSWTTLNKFTCTLIYYNLDLTSLPI